MPALVATAVLAAILGFSAHRASICTVRAVAELLHSRRGFMLASVVKSMLWISAVTIPFFLLSDTSPAPAGAWQLSAMTTTRIVLPTSVLASLYVELVAAGMSEQPVPDESQSRHR